MFLLESRNHGIFPSSQASILSFLWKGKDQTTLMKGGWNSEGLQLHIPVRVLLKNFVAVRIINILFVSSYRNSMDGGPGGIRVEVAHDY